MLFCRSRSPAMQISFSRWTILLFAAQIAALGDTDTITWGGDNSRCGYQPNHNMDPNVVASSDFGQIFSTLLPGNFNNMAREQIYASPLVYTGDDGVQYVFVATTQNNVYKLDAKTGAIVASRNLHVPFLQVELESCVDINPLIGITATGVIDPVTGIWYVTAKTYAEQFQDGNFSPQNPPGRLNGRYWQHAIHTEDLSEAAGWPVLLDGTVFRNNPNRMFIGGNEHSRPGALLVGDYLYTGYASHCVQYNYTGAIVGFHKTTGRIVEAFTTEGGPEANSIKGGGVWMSGGGLAYDGRGSMYFATGNGYASQLKSSGNALPGRTPPTSLEEAAVNAKINDDGTLTIIDFFMPWEKTQLDGADKDLGTSPLEILPSNVFSCPNDRRIGVVTGKSGKTYWLDLDNLGGYQMGANSLDAVIQVYQNENSVYAGAGVLPLDGGYIYIPVTRYSTHVFRFWCNSAGNAVFSKVSDTPDLNAYIIGTSHGTTTSLGGKEGTGLLWTTDVEGQGLRIYDPIPPSSGGLLRQLNGFNIPWVTKFSRPVFGDGRVYVSTTVGYLYGFGSPVNAAINCSSPYDFGPVLLGNASSPLTVTCAALIATRVDAIALEGDANFMLSNLPNLPLNLTSGQTFTFNASCKPTYVGPLSADAAINVTNGQPGFSSHVPVILQGTGHSIKPLLAITPNVVSFNIIAGNPSQLQSALMWNLGNNLLTFSNITFSLISETGPWVMPNITSDGNREVGKFVFTNIPTTILAGDNAPLTFFYASNVPGNHKVYVRSDSDGGYVLLGVFGVAGTEPKSVIEFQTVDGSGWVPYSNTTPFSFGTVYESQTLNLLMRITNGGGPNAVPLSITVSKPPYGVPGIIGKSNNIDLAEGTSLLMGQNATANMYCNVPKSQVNIPSYNRSTVWVMNTGDPNQGKQTIQFTCNAAAEQVGPLFPNGTARYGYIGCFKENNPSRQLAMAAYSDKNNTNDRCTTTCLGLGYIFAGTQYSQECWCGNTIPIQKDDDNNCNSLCTGNPNQICGGDGYFHDSSHISLFADSMKFSGNTTSPPLQLTQSVGNYNFLGCYGDINGRTLSDKATNSNTMTVEICQAFCSSFSPPYQYFGLEFAAECYCGAKLNPESKLLNSSSCNMPCKGSNSEYCGAGSVMQIYGPGNETTSSASSVTISTTRSSSSSIGTPTVSSGFNSTISSATTTSTSTLASIASTGTPVNTSSIATTSLTSSFLSTSNVVSASSSLISVSVISSTSSAPPSKSTAPSILSNYTYAGCYNEIQSRALNARTTMNDSMTLEYCASFCSGYTFFGVEYSRECYCGNGIPITSLQVTDNRCNMACSGNSAQICGGPNGLSIYQVTPATIGNPEKVGNYTALGCYTEKPSGRALPVISPSDVLTVELCAQQATTNGYTYFGLEYGRECWQGNILDGAVLSDQSHCAINCTGSALENCGGAYFLQVYVNGVSETTSSSAISTSTSSTLTSSGVSTTTLTTSASLTSSSPTSKTSLSSSSSYSSVSAVTSLATLSTTSSASQTSSTISSQAPSSSSTSSTPTASPTLPVKCPTWNSTIYTTSNGQDHYIECGLDRAGNDIGLNYTATFDQCISLCDNNPSCDCVSWVAGNSGSMPCYLKSAPGPAVMDSRIWGAMMVRKSTSSSSVATILATLSSYSITPTSSSSTLSSTATLNSTSSTSSSTSSATSPATNSVVVSSGTTVPTSSIMSNFSSSAVMSSSNAPTSSLTSSLPDSPTSSYSPGPSRTALSCPSSNTTLYTSLAGAQYLIECGIDHVGGDMVLLPSKTKTFEACIEVCESLIGCVDVSFSGVACYPKNIILPVKLNDDVWGARLVAPAPKSTVVSTAPNASIALLDGRSPSSSLSSKTSWVSTKTTCTILSSTSTTPIPTPLVGSYEYSGCWVDPNGIELPRALNALPVLANATSITPSLCAAYCAQFASFGLEHGSECWCGPRVSTNTTLAANQADCNMPCSGDPSSICGARNRLSLYKSSNPSKVSDYPAVPAAVIGNYSYENCIADTANPRLLQVVVTNSTMTNEVCVAAAEKGGYKYAGTEYGTECWMGNTLAGMGSGNGRVNENMCGMMCVGASAEVCGGPNLLNLWARKADV